ncbi:hypothetical protein LEL_08277 [Akanthomyces lecanii RCEF 1005]|uniref:Tat pathway signal sequence n=1 Tax=Akanthomyces lecanii RCEF 1005 TaxID=1081108 RepID=A0A168F5I7_CORDF|nr:hypothetical protein LEL_08277 [Akanthomyces lecanii RCEF 1005]
MKSEESGTRASTPTITEDQGWNARDSDGLPRSGENSDRYDGKGFRLLQKKTSAKFHLAIFSFYILTLVGMGFLLGRSWLSAKKRYLYSPANEAVEYYIGEFTDGNDPHGKYVGKPRLSLEKAWQNLLGPVGMSDGSGYLGTLNVYHELHCVRWLHKYVYQDEYWPALSDEQRQKNKVHSNHCLSTLKSFAMCHADVGLVIYSWQKDRLKPGTNGTGHTCANWDKIAQWTKSRIVDMYKPGLVIHPQLGPAYPEGQNDKENINGALHEHGSG